MTEAVAIELKGVVQHYEWGGCDFIPGLLGISNAERKPFAELWIGTHPRGPAMTEVAGSATSLDRLIAEAPHSILGPSVNARFGGRLPYMLKVLDVRKMLSIQIHPNQAQAEEGFARENAAGIDLRAAERNYKDAYEKSEVNVALTEFWMLHGFQPPEQIARTLEEIPELRSIMPAFSERLDRLPSDNGCENLLGELYRQVMTMPQAHVDGILNPLLTRLQANPRLDKSSPGFWALRAAELFPLAGGHRDRGIFSIYLLNLVHLHPGQGTYQPPGILHAYLEGVSVELMGNSDNVLRGGLTPKHVDAQELLRIVRCESSTPRVLQGDSISGAERVYRSEAEEYELSRIQLAPEEKYSWEASQGPELILTLSGFATLASGGRGASLREGSITFIPFGARYVLESSFGEAVLFKAVVPGDPNSRRVGAIGSANSVRGSF